jgi:hypothetical protein
MNQIKGILFLGAMALAVSAFTIPAQAQSASAKRDAAIQKCLEQTMAQTAPGSSSGFRSGAYHACMKKEKQRP